MRWLVEFEERVIHHYGARLYQQLSLARLRPVYQYIAEQVVAAHKCKSGGEILDVGCGPGNLLAAVEFIKGDLKLIGLDPSGPLLERARSRVSSAHFVSGVAEQLPFSDGRFDVVVSTGSIHHWRDPVDGISEIHRVLRPGGVFLLYDQRRYSGLYDAARALAQGFVGLGLTALSDDRLQQLMNDSLFINIRCASEGALMCIMADR